MWHCQRTSLPLHYYCYHQHQQPKSVIVHAINYVCSTRMKARAEGEKSNQEPVPMRINKEGQMKPKESLSVPRPSGCTSDSLLSPSHTQSISRLIIENYNNEVREKRGKEGNEGDREWVSSSLNELHSLMYDNYAALAEGKKRQQKTAKRPSRA